eukprot:TRINITY_DN107131_c0_g1_i1.p1 TRINITY_DN107131_c0_g1~~TRINITY_DN107131_c0_g1_i1.p1  ORF type:complete len:406 (-),score=56.06 TRINITY_DN107131_c0_g1_i1:143-1360(-)
MAKASERRLLLLTLAVLSFLHGRRERIYVALAPALAAPVTLQVVRASEGCQVVALASEGLSIDELTQSLAAFDCSGQQLPETQSSSYKIIGLSHERYRLNLAWKARTLLVASYDTYEWLTKGYVSSRGQPPDLDAVVNSMKRVAKEPHPSDMPHAKLLAFLKREYGAGKLNCLVNTVGRGTEDDIISELQDLFAWFRDAFPYYRGACIACGAQGDFIGLVSPSAADEAHGRVTVVELYACNPKLNETFGADVEVESSVKLPACAGTKVTSFPRYSSVALPVLQTRRGRCGEYSVLGMELVRALGMEARWINNHAGHVWLEAKVRNRWVHIDPCEAAVDKPFIYAQEWGRVPDHVLAYQCDVFNKTDVTVSDVTLQYRPPGSPRLSTEIQHAVAAVLHSATASGIS